VRGRNAHAAFLSPRPVRQRSRADGGANETFGTQFAICAMPFGWTRAAQADPAHDSERRARGCRTRSRLSVSGAVFFRVLPFGADAATALTK
jgi:hypothetical protein